MGRLVVAMSLAVVSLAAVAQEDISEQGRRYLNPIFTETVRHGDIVYAREFNETSKQTEALRLRVFEPVGDTQAVRPLIVLTPGGGFVKTGEDWMDDVAVQLARAGYVVALNHYRLAQSIESPELYFDALFKTVADQKAAIRYLIEDVKGKNRFRIDLDNVFIGGHSAGAIISLHTGYLNADDAMFATMAEPLEKYDALAPMDAALTVRGIINLAGLVTDLGILDAGEPPLLSIHGDNDSVVPLGLGDGIFGSQPIDEYAAIIGLESHLHIIVGAKHIDTANPLICEECVPIIKRFMFNHLDLSGTNPSLAIENDSSNNADE